MSGWKPRFSTYAERIEPSAIFSLVDMPRAADTINLGPGEPDPSFFPAAKLSEILAAELQSADRYKVALQYTVNAGLPELRRKISAYHAARGVACGPENVLITSGSQEAIDMVISAFVEPGGKAAVQSPTYPGAIGIFKAHGANICTIDEALANTPEELSVIYLTPTFANPTGETLDEGRRLDVVALARKTGALLIEDDAYETMSFEEGVPAKVQALDSSARGVDACQTVYTSTFSKSLVPGLRIGWLIGPQSVIRKLTLLKQSEDMQAGTLAQACAAAAMDFVMHEHVPVLRAEYRRRRDAMLGALEKHCGNLATWTRPKGGFFVWMTLPAHIDASELLRKAAMNGVTFVPGAACSHDGRHRNSLRLSYSTNPPERLERAIMRLSQSLQESM